MCSSSAMEYISAVVRQKYVVTFQFSAAASWDVIKVCHSEPLTLSFKAGGKGR